MTRSDALAALCAAAGLALIAGHVAADDRCAETRALPGAVTQEDRDLIVIAPLDDGGFQWCFWNSPSSAGATFDFIVSGEAITVEVEITSGPEWLRIDLPGAIATDLRGKPLKRVEAPDGGETVGMFWRGLM